MTPAWRSLSRRRRNAGAAACVAALSLVFALTSSQAETDRIDESTARAIKFLLSKQDQKGAIRESEANETAMTSLSIMALTAVGHQASDQTPEGTALRKALDFVLTKERQEKDGYFGKGDGSRMYGHGITTLMLAEMLGMGVTAEQDKQIRESCQKGIDLILKAQKVKKDDQQRGGWRYTPDATDSDLSVTVWQLMALRAAKNAGVAVPKDAIDEAVAYIKRSYKVDGDKKDPNARRGFTYQVGGAIEWATVAEGLLALQVAGQYETLEVIAAADWLRKKAPDPRSKWFFYGTYYYAQGMYQRGPDHAKEAAQRVADSLFPLQEADGSWKGGQGEEQGAGKIYRTTMAVLSLAVKYHYLPIYQR